jgi:hypothetical protein
MSHISIIKTQMVDKTLVLQVLADLGYKYEEGRFDIEGLGAKKTKVSIKIISRYGNDIGLRKNKGAYEIVADWWGVLRTNEKEFSDRLNQRYAYLAVKTKLEEQGFSLASEENKDGKIHLVLRRLS